MHSLPFTSLEKDCDIRFLIYLAVCHLSDKKLIHQKDLSYYGMFHIIELAYVEYKNTPSPSTCDISASCLTVWLNVQSLLKESIHLYHSQVLESPGWLDEMYGGPHHTTKHDSGTFVLNHVRSWPVYVSEWRVQEVSIQGKMPLFFFSWKSYWSWSKLDRVSFWNSLRWRHTDKKSEATSFGKYHKIQRFPLTPMQLA